MNPRDFDFETEVEPTKQHIRPTYPFRWEALQRLRSGGALQRLLGGHGGYRCMMLIILSIVSLVSRKGGDTCREAKSQIGSNPNFGFDP